MVGLRWDLDGDGGGLLLLGGGGGHRVPVVPGGGRDSQVSAEDRPEASLVGKWRGKIEGKYEDDERDLHGLLHGDGDVPPAGHLLGPGGAHRVPGHMWIIQLMVESDLAFLLIKQS